MQEGDLAEVIDESNLRIAVVRLQRLTPASSKLVALVVVGEEKCSSLEGATIRPLVAGSTFSMTSLQSNKNEMISVGPNIVFSQSSMPGLALNKFLTPGYSQRGLGIHAGGTFPKKPILIAKFNFKGTADITWSTSETSPGLDLVRDGQVLGTQKFSSQAFRIRSGGRIFMLKDQIWTGAGLTLFESVSSKSTLTAYGNNGDRLFPAVRPVHRQGFGLYLEQGMETFGSARVALIGGIGLGTSATTPKIEDGESTNTSDKFTISGVPLNVGLNLYVPIRSMAYTELGVELNTLKMQLPLINNQTTKAQIETLTFNFGAGVRF